MTRTCVCSRNAVNGVSTCSCCYPPVFFCVSPSVGVVALSTMPLSVLVRRRRSRGSDGKGRPTEQTTQTCQPTTVPVSAIIQPTTQAVTFLSDTVDVQPIHSVAHTDSHTHFIRSILARAGAVLVAPYHAWPAYQPRPPASCSLASFLSLFFSLLLFLKIPFSIFCKFR